MPTLRKDKDNQWWARLILNGRYLDGKFFPAGRKRGPEWTAAKAWEVNTKQDIEKLMAQGMTLVQAMLQVGLQPGPQFREEAEQEMKQKTRSACARLLAWGEAYLAHAERAWTHSTCVEKTTHLLAFFAFCREEGIESLEAVTKPKAYKFLAGVRDAKNREEAMKAKEQGVEPKKDKGASVANKYRKNLLAAWNWGTEFIDDFPQTICPFGTVKEFPTEQEDRYVPPESDVVKVLQQTKGQDLIMLLTLYFTGGRRGEIFRLSWTRDIHLDAGKIRLTDHKGGNGKKRSRWLDMHPELIKALEWWRVARPCEVDNVFMQTQNTAAMGLPYRQRNKFLARLCKRAQVKPFGFHAIRHKVGAVVFVADGMDSAQLILRHDRASTTDRYVKSAGLYARQDGILDALGKSEIGQAVPDLLETNFPHEGLTHGGNCNRVCVTQ